MRVAQKDPTLIEAHLLLSNKSHNELTRIQHLKVAVRAGDHFWGQVAAENGSLIRWNSLDIWPCGRESKAWPMLASLLENDAPLSSVRGASNRLDRATRQDYPVLLDDCIQVCAHDSYETPSHLL